MSDVAGSEGRLPRRGCTGQAGASSPQGPIVTDASKPLVTIGIPTYNRASRLRRTLDSAVAQTYRPLEILVYDDASEDHTEEICLSYVTRDPHLRYLRHPVRVGLTANFNALYNDCAGKYMLALSDDDWLDTGYVDACVAELERRPGYVIVGGLTRYYRNDQYVRTGTDRTLEQSSGIARVLAYVGKRGDTGSAYYGVMRADALKAALPMLDLAGSDWLLVSAVAFQGCVLTIPSVSVHRELGGVSAHLPDLVRRFGGGPVRARLPELALSVELVKDVGWRVPVYRSLVLPKRILFAIVAGCARLDWAAQAWYLVEPVASALGRHRATRWCGRCFEWLTASLLSRRHARLAAKDAEDGVSCP